MRTLTISTLSVYLKSNHKFLMESCLLFTNDFENILCTLNISTLQCGICRLPMVIRSSDHIFFACAVQNLSAICTVLYLSQSSVQIQNFLLLLNLF